MWIHAIAGLRPLNGKPGLRMVVRLHVKVRGRELCLRPVGYTPAVSVTPKRRRSCDCGLWRYISVTLLCVCLMNWYHINILWILCRHAPYCQFLLLNDMLDLWDTSMYLRAWHWWKCSEAEYAFNTQKRIVALRLEPGYKPDGWLGPLCRNNLFYDFSAPQKFDDEWSKLHAKLRELNRPAGWSQRLILTGSSF